MHRLPLLLLHGVATKVLPHGVSKEEKMHNYTITHSLAVPVESKLITLMTLDNLVNCTFLS